MKKTEIEVYCWALDDRIKFKIDKRFPKFSPRCEARRDTLLEKLCGKIPNTQPYTVFDFDVVEMRPTRLGEVWTLDIRPPN